MFQMIFIVFFTLFSAAQLQDLQDSQELQDYQDFQNSLDLQDSQKLQGYQDLQDPEDSQELQDQCASGPCSPKLGDLMVGRAAQLSASSTCGLDGPQNYCIIGYLEEEQKCFICDSRLPFDPFRNPSSHRIDNIITSFDPERKLKWWQSQNGVHQVSIQLDLEAMFQFSHLILTFKSFCPAAMLVERSKDFGRTWEVFRYFAENCSHHFPTVSDKKAVSVNDIICDSRYSGSEPSTGGEVVLKALDPIFEVTNPYTADIQDLITLTNLRVNFTQLFTLGDTLLSRRRRNPLDKYYYAVYNMVVRGSCFCNGHSNRCSPVDGGREQVFTYTDMVYSHCVCRHNTAGDNCERCQDFHHDTPWRPGGGNTADICKRCNCHGHCDSCHFDAVRFQATGGVSGGVCDNCLHNRTGPQCERCQPLLFQDPQRATNDPHACISCDCDPAGSQAGGLCDALTGQCVCKQNVEGRRCDRCKHGFFSLSRDDPDGCQVCRCHVLGSVGSCNELTGSCKCDQFTIGLLCDQCQAGFWGLGNSVYRCSPCSCDIGGAHSNTCSQEDGQCHCLPNMIGRRCSDPARGYFLPALDYFLYEAELAVPLHGASSSLLNTVVLPPCEQYFRDQGYHFKFSNGRIVLVRRTRQLPRQRRQQTSIPLDPGHAVQVIPRSSIANQRLTFTGLGLVRVMERAGLRFTVDNLPSSMEFSLVIRYETEFPSDWLASVSIITLSAGNGSCSSDPSEIKTVILPGNSRVAVLDSALCLNTGGRYFVDIFFNKDSRSDGSHVLIDSVGLVPSIYSVQDFCSHSDLDSFRHFRCIGLTAELNNQESIPKDCERLIRSMSARIHNGALQCRCNIIGSLSPFCSKLGGVCECKPNVIGRCCNTCSALTFGFGPDGCKPCECDPRGSLSELCDQIRGQCACRPVVRGRRCDHCQTGFWGFPICRPCRCNGHSNVCDEGTGECLNCKEHTDGPHCERCVEGYYGNPGSGQSCQPCLCPDVKSSGRFFATSCYYDPWSLRVSCRCREGYSDPHCDRCSPGYYGDLTLPGAHCERCHCNNNIDLEDRNSCDGLTGECLLCLHNTTGPHCQNCKPGYYGNALNQHCKECSCDRRGTQMCPMGSPCFCDPRTGQCPCRKGVEGVLCNQCEDGYWNLSGALGCQPCSCDPVNSVSNKCNKLTGQCPGHPEFGGIRCDECRNPDLPETDISSNKCHSCHALWAMHVADVQRAAWRLKNFIPHISINLPPSGYKQWLQDMHSKLGGLTNLTGIFPAKLMDLEHLCVTIRKLKDSTDLNMIRIDPSPLLNTEIDNIYLEFEKMLNSLKEQHVEDEDTEETDLEELQNQIQKLYKDFMSDEERLRNSTRALEVSMDTRQEVKSKLNMCRSSGDLASLEKKIEEFIAVKLHSRVCGGLCLHGALCNLDLSPDCGAVLPVIQKSSETAERAKDKLTELPSTLDISRSKIDDVVWLAWHATHQAGVLQDQLNNSTDVFMQEKRKSGELLQRANVYLMDEMVPAEDIDEMVQAVLTIQLPRSPDQTRSVIANISNLRSSPSNFQDDLKKLEEQSKTSQYLLQNAQELKEQMKNTNITEISRDTYKGEQAQDKASSDLESASKDKTTTEHQIQKIESRLDKIEMKLMSSQSEDLKDNTESLNNLTNWNSQMAREAADSAVNTGTTLNDMMKQVELLKQQKKNLRFQEVAAERVRNMVDELEQMKTEMEEKLQQILDLEHRIQQLIQNKQQKSFEVFSLLGTVESLEEEISRRAAEYVQCTL